MLAMQALGSYPITLAGEPEQKALYLPAIAKRECIMAFALTEAEAGSDVSCLTTRAVRHDGAFRLSGTKRFVSNAGIANNYLVFASTNPGLRGKGISAFIVNPTLSGVIIKEKSTLLSPHPIGMIYFDDCIVPESHLIGGEDHGLQLGFQTLDLLRCTVGAAALGFAQRALDEAICTASSDISSVGYRSISGSSIPTRGNGNEPGGGALVGLSSGLGAR
jgi:acyl-CoA dehydrogenase